MVYPISNLVKNAISQKFLPFCELSCIQSCRNDGWVLDDTILAFKKSSAWPLLFTLLLRTSFLVRERTFVRQSVGNSVEQSQQPCNPSYIWVNTRDTLSSKYGIPVFYRLMYETVYVAIPKQNTEYQYWKHTEVSLPVWLFK